MKPPTAAGREECLAVKLQFVSKYHRDRCRRRFCRCCQMKALMWKVSDGGLIGERIKQGMCREPERSTCFCSPSGRLLDLCRHKSVGTLFSSRSA